MPESGQGDVSLVGLGSQSVSVYFKCTLSGHRRVKNDKNLFLCHVGRRTYFVEGVM